MSFQGNVNSLIGMASAATKINNATPQKGKMSFSELNSAMAFQKSNQGLIEEYSKKKTNLERSRNALTKMGRWGQSQDEKINFYNEQIKKYTNIDKAVSGRISNNLNELQKEGE